MTASRRIVPNKIYHLFKEPNVFVVKGNSGIDALLPQLKPGDWCFESLMWFLTWRSAFNYVKRWQYMKARGINYIVMANSAAEVKRCKLLKIPVRLMPQGQFINEHAIPTAELGRACQYDAFYAAQAKPFKRLYLAKDIENIYVLTYSCPSDKNGNNDLSLVEPKLHHAAWNLSYIHDESLVFELMHSSSCALALSKVEGAMWAALEANICGIPIVSTKSLGGRDRYFTSENSRIVSANSQAVKGAVNFYKLNPPHPKIVRESTLDLIKKDRQATAKYFCSDVLQHS